MLSRCSTDDYGEVIGRASRGAELLEVGVDKVDKAFRVEQCSSFLKEEGLVGRTAALGHKQELVRVALRGSEFDLGWQVVLSVLLFEHRERRELAIAKVRREVGIADALGNHVLVVEASKDVLTLFALHDCGSGVLAHRQNTAGRDVRVLKELLGNEVIVWRRVGIVEDPSKHLKMRSAQIMGNVVHCRRGQRAKRLGFDL